MSYYFVPCPDNKVMYDSSTIICFATKFKRFLDFKDYIDEFSKEGDYFIHEVITKDLPDCKQFIRARYIFISLEDKLKMGINSVTEINPPSDVEGENYFCIENDNYYNDFPSSISLAKSV